MINILERGIVEIPGHEGIYYSPRQVAKRMGVSSSEIRRILREEWNEYARLMKEKGFEVPLDSVVKTEAGYYYLRSELVKGLFSAYYRPVKS